jgi:hypothetical protein
MPGKKKDKEEKEQSLFEEPKKPEPEEKPKPGMKGWVPGEDENGELEIF